MVVIISKSGDESANKVIDWLKYYNCSYTRIDISKEYYGNINITFEEEKIEIVLRLTNGELINLNHVSFFFYRSGLFNKDFKNLGGSIIPETDFERHHTLEFDTLTNFFYSEVSKKSIGFINALPLNKLNQIYLAKKNGLYTPDTYIRNNKDDLSCIFKKNKIINKSIQENIMFQYANKVYLQRVSIVDFSSLPDTFFPSLFQKYVTKLFEARTFYLDGKCYSIAIYSKYMGVDYRDSYRKQNYSPINLPVNIELLLCNLMNELGLVSGSIDWIYSEDKFYFLEVNTQGQYDWVSEYGQYNLHKKIAKFLHEKENDSKKLFE